jgi:hypothetical protein
MTVGGERRRGAFHGIGRVHVRTGLMILEMGDEMGWDVQFTGVSERTDDCLLALACWLAGCTLLHFTCILLSREIDWPSDE